MNNPIEALAYHTAPLGPLGDSERRRREEQEWLDSLSSADVLKLLEWVRRPAPLGGDYPVRACDIPDVRYAAAEYAGKAGRRLKDDRVRNALEELLSHPESRSPAIAGLAALGDPSTAPLLARYAVDADPATAIEIAISLGQIGGPDAIDALEAMRQRWSDHPKVRSVISSALDEARHPEEKC